jgi:hypothetical protein
MMRENVMDKRLARFAAAFAGRLSLAGTSGHY